MKSITAEAQHTPLSQSEGRLVRFSTVEEKKMSKRTKIIVKSEELSLGGFRFTVLQTENCLTPRVKQVLSEKELDSMIRADRNLTVVVK